MAGGIAHYLWKAFTRPWNLLLVLGASAAAAMTPAPDVLLPLIAAAEAVYLGALVSLPRFRQAIDAQAAERAREGSRVQAPSTDQLLVGLRAEAQKRFNDLRRRCLEMRSIARAARPLAAGETDLWTPALDRLLYGFLRLLGHQSSLQRFLQSTTVDELTKRLDDLKKRLETAKGSGDERMLRSLEESIEIAEQRLENYQRAVKNADFAALELDRVETKIHALIELAANRQDPDFLSDQVDAAAASMDHTEATLNQLQQITGVTDQLDEVPPILDEADKPTMRRRD
jgi:phage shock protein A